MNVFGVIGLCVVSCVFGFILCALLTAGKISDLEDELWKYRAQEMERDHEQEKIREENDGSDRATAE